MRLKLVYMDVASYLLSVQITEFVLSDLGQTTDYAYLAPVSDIFLVAQIHGAPNLSEI